MYHLFTKVLRWSPSFSIKKKNTKNPNWKSQKSKLAARSHSRSGALNPDGPSGATLNPARVTTAPRSQPSPGAGTSHSSFTLQLTLKSGISFLMPQKPGPFHLGSAKLIILLTQRKQFTFTPLVIHSCVKREAATHRKKSSQVLTRKWRFYKIY